MTDKKQTVEEYLKENLIHVYSDEDEAKDVFRMTFKAVAMARAEMRKGCDEKIEDAYAGGEQFGRYETAKEIFEEFEKNILPDMVMATAYYKNVKTRFLGKGKEARK